MGSYITAAAPLQRGKCVQVGNSWRTTADIEPTWEGILRCLDNTIGLSQFAVPGGFNDPDMLEARLSSELQDV